LAVQSVAQVVPTFGNKIRSTALYCLPVSIQCPLELLCLIERVALIESYQRRIRCVAQGLEVLLMRLFEAPFGIQLVALVDLGPALLGKSDAWSQRNERCK
jgi:hypothetical protein